ncbi:hypothetical protein Dimus_013185, partial [Dionaea muscipula]
KGRRLRKSTSVPVAEVDSEETHFDKKVSKLASDSDAVGGEEEEKEEVRVITGNSSPMAEELEKEVDELLAQAFQHSFISESLISLDDLVQEHKEEGPSGRTVGSDGGMSREETEDVVPQAYEVEKDEEDNVVGYREGKGPIVEEEEEEEEDEESGL